MQLRDSYSIFVFLHRWLPPLPELLSVAASVTPCQACSSAAVAPSLLRKHRRHLRRITNRRLGSPVRMDNRQLVPAVRRRARVSIDWHRNIMLCQLGQQRKVSEMRTIQFAAYDTPARTPPLCYRNFLADQSIFPFSDFIKCLESTK